MISFILWSIKHPFFSSDCAKFRYYKHSIISIIVLFIHGTFCLVASVLTRIQPTRQDTKEGSTANPITRSWFLNLIGFIYIFSVMDKLIIMKCLLDVTRCVWNTYIGELDRLPLVWFISLCPLRIKLDLCSTFISVSSRFPEVSSSLRFQLSNFVVFHSKSIITFIKFINNLHRPLEKKRKTDFPSY